MIGGHCESPVEGAQDCASRVRGHGVPRLVNELRRNASGWTDPGWGLALWFWGQFGESGPFPLRQGRALKVLVILFLGHSRLVELMRIQIWSGIDTRH